MTDRRTKLGKLADELGARPLAVSLSTFTLTAITMLPRDLIDRLAQ